MKYGTLLSRIEVLEEKCRPDEMGPWPPKSGIGKILYDQLIERGINVQPPPEGRTGLIHLLNLGTEDTFRDELSEESYSSMSVR